MTQQSRVVQANGIDIAITEQGTGPLVLLCHGWPELSFSWRHQIPVLAAAGYHVVAPDMRGYGGTSAPADINAYSILDLVGDMVALVKALGETQAIIIGHDWGANVAWHCALFRPDVFPAVAALSVPFAKRASMRPLEKLRRNGIANFYWHYFQTPGVVEAEFAKDWNFAIRAVMYGRGVSLIQKLETGFLDHAVVPDAPPAWISEAELAHYVETFKRTGLAGGFNWYRNIDRNWDLSAPWQGAKIPVPAVFIAGAKDGTIQGEMGAARLREMETIVPQMREVLIIDNAGHWIQQERPEQVNEALLRFLSGL